MLGKVSATYHAEVVAANPQRTNSMPSLLPKFRAPAWVRLCAVVRLISSNLQTRLYPVYFPTATRPKLSNVSAKVGASGRPAYIKLRDSFGPPLDMRHDCPLDFLS